ncbi:MAG: acetyl-CoA decarbonylase/synthase complex subunit delta [Candidatus Desulforudis sp.]|nr:acetyl-CoA decarbonylase/synthase complex subunit delta [Desulforudis sp.]
MAVKIVRERWPGKVYEMVLGRRPNTVRVGGDTSLPFIHFEGEPKKPVVALEIQDIEPLGWPEVLWAPFAGLMSDPVAWARRCVEYGADLVALRLAGVHPESGDAGAEAAAAVARSVAQAVDVPLVVLGCGMEEKDARVLPVVAEALEGYNCLIGQATVDNYKPVAAGCRAYGHSVVATSPLDINLAKQLNILITEMNLPPERIAMDPSIGPLGYGIEYAYSIIERKRLGALMGDRMLAPPVICLVGEEAWKTREAQVGDTPEWGNQARRAVLWETMTAVMLALAGGSIFVLRHPESLARFQGRIDVLMQPQLY